MIEGTKVVYKKSELTVGKKKVEFQYNIAEVIVNNNQVFVMLEIPTTAKLDEDVVCNILAYDFSGSLQWKIKNTLLENSDVKHLYPLVLMNLNEEGVLFTTDWYGRRFQVDINTGAMSLIGVFR